MSINDLEAKFPVGSELRARLIARVARELRASPHYVPGLKVSISRAAQETAKLRSLLQGIGWLAREEAFLVAHGLSRA